MCRYAPTLVADEKDMCRHFELGLRDEIQVRLSSTMFRDFNKFVDVALIVEFSLSRSRPR